MSAERAMDWIKTELVKKIVEKMQVRDAAAEVIEVQQLEGNKDNWASVMFTLKFNLRHADGIEKIDLLLKLMDESENVRRMMQSDKQFSNEIYTYSTFVPLVISKLKKPSIIQKLESLFPRCYYSCFSGLSSPPKLSDGVVALENLKPLGFKLGNRESLDFDHLMLAVDCLGSYHAMSYFMKERHADEFFAKLVPPIHETMFLPNQKEEVEIAFGVPNSRVLQLLRKDLPEGEAGFQRLTEATKDPYPVLSKLVEPKEPLAVVNHGDFLRNNVLFRYDSTGKPDAMKMLDFQTVRYASPAIDLGLILWMNSTHEVRVKHWDTLLEKYHRSVVDTLADMLEEEVCRVEERYSYRAFREDFRKHSLHGYFITVNFLPWMLAEPDDLAELVALWRADATSQAHKNKMMTIGGEKVNKELKLVAKDFINLTLM